MSKYTNINGYEFYGQEGNSRLYYNNNLGEFVIDRFDEEISLGDISLEEAMTKMHELEF